MQSLQLKIPKLKSQSMRSTADWRRQRKEAVKLMIEITNLNNREKWTEKK